MANSLTMPSNWTDYLTPGTIDITGLGHPQAQYQLWTDPTSQKQYYVRQTDINSANPWVREYSKTGQGFQGFRANVASSPFAPPSTTPTTTNVPNIMGPRIHTQGGESILAGGNPAARPNPAGTSEPAPGSTLPPQPAAAPSALELYKSYQEAFKPRELTYTPVQGLGQSWYDNQKNAIKENLRREFFGPVGTVQQTASNESAAGRLGSGVGKRIIEETAMRPFADAITAADSQVNQQQAADNLQRDQFNESMRAQYAQLNQQARSNLDTVIMGLIDGDIQMSDQELDSWLKQQELALADRQIRLQEDEFAMGAAQSPMSFSDTQSLYELYNSFPADKKEEFLEQMELLYPGSANAIDLFSQIQGVDKD